MITNSGQLVLRRSPISGERRSEKASKEISINHCVLLECADTISLDSNPAICRTRVGSCHNGSTKQNKTKRGKVSQQRTKSHLHFCSFRWFETCISRISWKEDGNPPVCTHLANPFLTVKQTTIMLAIDSISCNINILQCALLLLGFKNNSGRIRINNVHLPEGMGSRQSSMTTLVQLHQWCKTPYPEPMFLQRL